MKARFTLPFFVSIFIISNIANAQGRSHETELDGLQGSVKEVESIMYEATEKGTRGKPIEHLRTVYNERGQRHDMAYLAIEEDSVMFRTRYKHDAFGQTMMEHIIDNNEHIIGRTYYIYNNDFILTESYVEDAERQVEHRVLYLYDKEGRLSQRLFNDPQGQIYRREVFVYNPSGTVNKTVVYNRQKEKMQEIHYEYDGNRQVLSKTLYDYTEAEPELFFTVYDYQYDDNGNWTRKTEYSLESDKRIPQYVTDRMIEYFESEEPAATTNHDEQ